MTDYGHKIVYARPGDRLRIAAMVDIGYDGEEIRDSRVQALKKISSRTASPICRGWMRLKPRTGMRPSTPAGPPMLGRAGYQNLWMNLGRGSLGFYARGRQRRDTGSTPRWRSAGNFFRWSDMETIRMTIIRNNPQPRLSASVEYGNLVFLSGQTPKKQR